MLTDITYRKSQHIVACMFTKGQSGILDHDEILDSSGNCCTIITQAPHDFVATAECHESSTDELQGVLHLSIGVCDDVPIVSPHQSRWQRLAVGTTGNLALPPGIHPQTEDVQVRLAQPPPQAQ